MECFPVRYDSRVVIYDRRAFIRLATGGKEPIELNCDFNCTRIFIELPMEGEMIQFVTSV